MRSIFLLSSTLLITTQIAFAQTSAPALGASSQPVLPAENTVSEKQPVDAPSSQPAQGSITTVKLPAPGETRLVEKDEAIALTKVHGSKLLIINYWATWCSPCLAEMPYFQAVHEQYAEKGVKVVGYSMDYDAYLDEAEKATTTSLKRLGITYPSLSLKVDSQETFPFFSDEWSGGLPATFFYDENGKKLFEFLTDVSKEELVQKVEELLEALEKPE
ncbi:MAG: redoxin domain-containing protein [Sumerlaeia bacterium]